MPISGVERSRERTSAFAQRRQSYTGLTGVASIVPHTSSKAQLVHPLRLTGLGAAGSLGLELESWILADLCSDFLCGQERHGGIPPRMPYLDRQPPQSCTSSMDTGRPSMRPPSDDHFGEWLRTTFSTNTNKTIPKSTSVRTSNLTAVVLGRISPYPTVVMLIPLK